ncbi:MAG: hypothetical protein HQL46_09220 [Gammaproteobacteria bacterium]|nr:hypothetical protein [Gammaproteobacteria bacterium]
MKNNFQIRAFLFIILFALILAGCGNEYEAKIQLEHASTKSQLDALGNALDRKDLINIKLVDIYARKLANLKPELKPVSRALAKDATREGSLYKGLNDRLAKVNLKPENKQEYIRSLESLTSVYAGSDKTVFNDSLLDLINTMADLSDGQLARVSIPKNENTAHVKGEKVTPGSYLVGNPVYGSYRQDSNGNSFWHWYGQYAFFSSMFNGSRYNNGPIYYDRWNSTPRYSYYNDYGRSGYGSRTDRSYTSGQNKKMRNSGISPAKPKKQYGSVQGRKRMSTYSQQNKNINNNMGKKYGSGGSGPRHSGIDSGKRSSSLFSKSSGKSSVSKPAKRTSGFFSNSRSSSSRSSFSRGGK